MIFESNGCVRLTPHELNCLRQRSAQNGEVVNAIKTRDELLAAVIGGLTPCVAEDLLEFLETGNSPLTRQCRTARESYSPVSPAAGERDAEP